MFLVAYAFRGLCPFNLFVDLVDIGLLLDTVTKFYTVSPLTHPVALRSRSQI